VPVASEPPCRQIESPDHVDRLVRFTSSGWEKACSSLPRFDQAEAAAHKMIKGMRFVTKESRRTGRRFVTSWNADTGGVPIAETKKGGPIGPPRQIRLKRLTCHHPTSSSLPASSSRSWNPWISTEASPFHIPKSRDRRPPTALSVQSRKHRP